nr:uncharacterized protein LOC105485608 [Macaca nemestrina]
MAMPGRARGSMHRAAHSSPFQVPTLDTKAGAQSQGSKNSTFVHPPNTNDPPHSPISPTQALAPRLLKIFLKVSQALWTEELESKVNPWGDKGNTPGPWTAVEHPTSTPPSFVKDRCPTEDTPRCHWICSWLNPEKPELARKSKSSLLPLSTCILLETKLKRRLPGGTAFSRGLVMAGEHQPATPTPLASAPGWREMGLIVGNTVLGLSP